MPVHHVTTLDGAAATLSDDALAALQKNLRSPLLRSGDSDYESARQVWNGMFDRRPGMIVACAAVAAVVHAVRFAHDHRLLVAVRGGDHSVAGL